MPSSPVVPMALTNMSSRHWFIRPEKRENSLNITKSIDLTRINNANALFAKIPHAFTQNSVAA